MHLLYAIMATLNKIFFFYFCSLFYLQYFLALKIFLLKQFTVVSCIRLEHARVREGKRERERERVNKQFKDKLFRF